MVIISNFGVLDYDNFLIERYEDFLYQEHNETIKSCEDFIPFKLEDYTYIVVLKSTYEKMSNEELQELLNMLNNY